MREEQIRFTISTLLNEIDDNANIVAKSTDLLTIKNQRALILNRTREIRNQLEQLRVESLEHRLKKMQEAFDECENRLQIAHQKAMRWDKLRNWLNNLMTQESVTKTEKKGIKIALNIMDRIEEDTKERGDTS